MQLRRLYIKREKEKISGGFYNFAEEHPFKKMFHFICSGNFIQPFGKFYALPLSNYFAHSMILRLIIANAQI